MATERKFKSGDPCTTSGAYVFERHTDGTTNPAPQERVIHLTKGDNFPAIGAPSKEAEWRTQSISERIKEALTLDPPELAKICKWAAFMTMGTFALAALLGITNKNPQGYQGLTCSAQHQSRKENEDKQTARISNAQKRIDRFTSALAATTDPLFKDAREQLAIEEREKEAATRSLKTYSMPSRLESIQRITLLTLLISITTILPLFFGKLLIRHSAHAGISHKELNNHWRGPYSAISLGSWLISTACGVYTSIISTEKTWFSWDNFCTTPSAWLVLRATELAIALIIAGPLALLWSAGHRDTVPSKLELNRYKAGVGSYALFLQTWCIVCAFIASLILLPWIKLLLTSEQGTLPLLVYILSGAGVVIPIILIIGRFIRNGILLRHQFEHLKAEQIAAGTAVVAEDPTKDFLGESWWSLPASLAGMFGVTWALLDWTGIMKILSSK